jgi:hypothetical protein
LILMMICLHRTRLTGGALKELRTARAEPITAFRASARRDEEAVSGPSEDTRRLLLEANELHEKFSAAVNELQDAIGIPADVFEELERAQLPLLERVPARRCARGVASG